MRSNQKVFICAEKFLLLLLVKNSFVTLLGIGASYNIITIHVKYSKQYDNNVSNVLYDHNNYVSSLQYKVEKIF